MSDPTIHNITILKNEYDLNYMDDIKKEKVKKLLPETRTETISFYIKNANTAIANGLRRIISGEIKVKRLSFEMKHINTNEEYIKHEELLTRLACIPIDQDIPLDIEFSINITNTNVKEGFFIVKSSDIKHKNTYSNTRPVFATTYKLAELKPGKHLIIPKIKVVEGYGYDDASFCLTTQIEYNIIDFIRVEFLNERSNFDNKIVKKSELISLFKKLKIQHSNPDELYKKKILIIPNKNYEKLLNHQTKNSIKNFDIIIENPENIEKNTVDTADNFLRSYQSTEIKATEFYLSITSNGNIDPKQIMIKACDNIKERLDNIKKYVIEFQKNENTEHETISIQIDNMKTTIILRGEDMTISQLIKITMFELDPNVGLLNDPIEHASNRTITLNIKHTQPLILLSKALDVCIGHFDKIRGYF